jgi:Domain of unknown function (DUF4760)
MWEALTAIGTLFTALVILLTVVLGLRQLRNASEQLQHLRRTALLEATMSIFSRERDSAFVDAEEFVFTEMPARWQDEAFQREARLGFRSRDPDVRKCLTVLKSYEEIGTYSKNGLLDETVLIDIMSPGILRLWENLGPMISAHRERSPRSWENFGLLYESTKRWRDEHFPDPADRGGGSVGGV